MMVYRLFAFLTLTILPFALFSAPLQAAAVPSYQVLQTENRTAPSKKVRKALVKKRKRDKKPFTILGYEPFTASGLLLIAGGIFVPALLPLGILSLVFGYVRYHHAEPDSFKGQKKHKKIFLIGLLIPVLTFLGVYAINGNP